MTDFKGFVAKQGLKMDFLHAADDKGSLGVGELECA
jgi:hypothetical protein